MANCLASHLCTGVCEKFNKNVVSYSKCLKKLRFAKINNVHARYYKTSSRLHLCSKEAKNTSITTQWKKLMNQYEEFAGLADVQRAQEAVKQAESEFLTARAAERAAMKEVSNVRERLKHVRERLSHVDFSNPLYPVLANEQHELVTLEDQVQLQANAAEEQERDSFMDLSAAMRDSYEKERTRVENTKNWSLIGTIVGAVIGMLGSLYINRVRTNDIRLMIRETSNTQELKETIDQVIPHTQVQYDDIKSDIKNLQVALVNKLLAPSKVVVDEGNIEEQSSFDFEMSDFVTMMKGFQAQLQHLLDNTNRNEKILTAQNDDLREHLVRLKITDSLPEIRHEIGDVNRKLDQVGAILKNNEVNKVKGPLDLDPAEDRYFLYAKHMAIWGSVVSAIYYITSS